MVRAKELAEKENPRKDIKTITMVFQNLALNTQGIEKMSDLEKESWGDLEKTLSYGKIAEVLEKLLKIEDALERNVSKRVFFENLFLGH